MRLLQALGKIRMIMVLVYSAYVLRSMLQPEISSFMMIQLNIAFLVPRICIAWKCLYRYRALKGAFGVLRTMLPTRFAIIMAGSFGGSILQFLTRDFLECAVLVYFGTSSAEASDSSVACSISRLMVQEREQDRSRLREQNSQITVCALGSLAGRRTRR